MLRNIFRASISGPTHREISTQCELDATQTSILWTQTENIFGLIESYVEQFLNHNFSREDDLRQYEERLDLFYQLLGTVIVEKESEQFQKKIEIDCKLAQCKYKLERSKGLEKSKNINDELKNVLNTFERFKNAKVELTKENNQNLESLKKILNDLTPKQNENDTQTLLERQTSFNLTKHSEAHILHKLKTIQSFWKTIFNNLQPSLSKETREHVQSVLQSLNVEIVLKLKELHVEPEDEPPVSINSFTSNDQSNDYDDENEDMQPFKDPARMHTFETLQIARKTVKLKTKISELIEELENSDVSKYDKLRKILDKLQDGFEDIESHYNTDLVALRTETFNKLLLASKMMNDLYEKKLVKN